MGPEISLSIQMAPSLPPATDFSKTGIAQKLRQAQEEQQKAQENTASAQTSAQEAQNNLQAAQAKERRTSEQVGLAQAEQRKNSQQPQQFKMTGRIINLLA